MRLLTGIALLLGSFSPCGAATVNRGHIDLTREWRENSVVDLDGDWRLHWNRPENIDSLALLAPDGYFFIPGYWPGYDLNGKILPDTGYATFSLTVLLPADFVGKSIALQTPDQNAAYTVWVNNTKISSGGNAGTTSASTTSQAALHIASFIPASQRVEIAMRVSNFNGGGGPHRALSIGTHEAVLRRFAVRHGLDLLFLGALLLAGFFHLGLYSLRRQMHSYLYFASFVLCWALRFFVEGIFYRPITFFLPDLSYEQLSRLEVVSAAPTSGLLLLFVYSLFLQDSSHGWRRFTLAGSAVLLVMSVFAPVEHLAGVLIVFWVFSFMLVWPLFVALLKAIRNRRDGAWLVLAGAVLFTGAATNDTLYSLRVIDTAYSISFGVIALTLLFSTVLSRRFAHAYAREKHLTHELAEKNRSLSQLDALKDDFIAGTSHELRTPLQGIVGLAEGLCHGAQSDLSPRLTEGLSLIAASGRRLTHLVNDIQDYSRIKNKELNLTKRAVDIRSLFSTVLTLVQTLKRSENVTLNNALPVDFPLVLGDEERLEQVFYNLVGNALKYTTQGAITVSGQYAEGMGVVRIEDTGIGIRKDKLQSLFLPYEQVGDDKHQQAGTGIGLSITRRLIELHGGSIAVESQYGQGSCFTITLPLAPGDAVCEAPPELLSSVLPDVAFRGLPVQSKDVQKVGGTILVVDDDSVNRKVFTTIIGARYTIVLEASDGLEALEIIDRRPIDLVLLDIMMPGIDGYETLKRIREKYSPLELPVLFLTAKNRSADLTCGFAAGANDYLTKPCGSEELCARVASQMQFVKVAALKEENRQLVGVIETERRVQQQSLIALGRMHTMLDGLSDPVALVDETHTICYANRAFCVCGKMDPASAGGTPLRAVIDDSAFTPMLDTAFSDPGDTRGPLTHSARIIETTHTLTLVPVMAGDESLVMITVGHSDNVSTEQKETIDPASKSGKQQLRKETAGKAIAEAIQCWSRETSLPPLELARQSGLWRIHINPDGWERAKTLDRYLSNSDFPQNPRIKTIHATIAFVLERIGPQNPDYLRLKRHYDLLKQWM